MRRAFGTSSRWLLLLAALALFAAACAPAAEEPEAEETETEATEEPTVTEEEVTIQEGGTVVFGADQEPAIMNPLLTEGNLFATSVIVRPVLWPLYVVTPDFEYEPLMLEGEAEEAGGEGDEPFSVTLTLRDDVVWSDGEPITADDILFSIETKLNEDFDITSREGFDQVDLDATEVIDERTIRIVFTEPYAPYRDMFSTSDGVVLPSHVLEGEDFNTVWSDGIVDPASGEPIGSGPFLLESWNKGQDATLVRNENFWGDPQPALDSVVYRFIEESAAQVQALEGREVDMIYPQPQLGLTAQVEALDGVSIQANAGTVWEHLDFNFVIPPLDQAYVRQAIAMGIDREAIVSELIAPEYEGSEPLNNAIWMSNQEQYEAHDYPAYDPEGARQLLEDNGCTQGDDGIYECEGERMSFDYTTTAGNELRELQLEIIQAQLGEIGIEINSATEPADTAFGTTLVTGAEGAWDLFNFAWVGVPDPSGTVPIFTCEGEQNYQSYCNEEVTDLLGQTNTEVDPETRAGLFNEADALMAQDVPILPLYQKPTFFAYHDDIVGLADNATEDGPTWNIHEWALAE